MKKTTKQFNDDTIIAALRAELTMSRDANKALSKSLAENAARVTVLENVFRLIRIDPVTFRLAAAPTTVFSYSTSTNAPQNECTQLMAGLAGPGWIKG